MANPFAWMVGQIQEAIAHQEPAGSVALPTGRRSVVACIKSNGGPITVHDLAHMAQINPHMAAQRMYKAERAGVVRVVGRKKWRGRSVRVYDLSGDWI